MSVVRASVFFSNAVVEENLNKFCECVAVCLDEGMLDDRRIHVRLVSYAKCLGIFDEAVFFLPMLLFSVRNNNITTDIRANADLFLCFTAESFRAQRFFMDGLEFFVSLYADQLLLQDTVLDIMNAVYNAYILDKEFIRQWTESPHPNNYMSREISKKFHNMVQPFVQMLYKCEYHSSESD